MLLSLQVYSRWLLPILAGILVIPVPMLGDFHLESAIFVSIIGCFWAGWIARGNLETRKFGGILRWIYLFAFPLFVYAIIKGCLGTDGVIFWMLLPLPSVAFGYTIGRLFHKIEISYPRFFTLLALVVVAVGTLTVEFFSLPQVYFFNHVWGYWPGPIYDESVPFTSSLIYYRLITFGWIFLLWFLPSVSKKTLSRWMVTAMIALLVLGYLRLPENGIISPRGYIQQELGGEKKTEHFTLYYAEEYYSESEIERIALEHEFHFQQLSHTLNLDFSSSDQKIESYLYAHPWQKKELVGAKFTSYVPVWLDRDQLHIAKPQVESTLKHELVHVIAKQFGNRFLNASWSIGLVEGLATALAPRRSGQSTLDQIVSSEPPVPTAEEMESFFAPLGFYGGRSNVNYTTSGSFVDFLLREYPVDQFKEAYRTGDIPAAYSKSMEQLVNEWHQRLDTVKVDSVDQQVAARLFGVPSLFEQACPRLQTDFEIAWDQYRFFRAEKDTTRALEYLEQASSLQPKNWQINSEWAFESLNAGKAEKVVRNAELEHQSINLHLLYADALALSDSLDQARLHVQKAVSLASLDGTDFYDEAVALRLHPEQWKLYRSIIYLEKWVNEQTFGSLFYRTKIRAVQQAMERERWKLVADYSRVLEKNPVDLKSFEDYIDLVHQLAFLQEWQLAESWIQKLEAKELRPRFQQRLDEEKAWLNFLQNYQKKQDNEQI